MDSNAVLRLSSDMTMCRLVTGLGFLVSEQTGSD